MENNNLTWSFKIKINLAERQSKFSKVKVCCFLHNKCYISFSAKNSNYERNFSSKYSVEGKNQIRFHKYKVLQNMKKCLLDLDLKGAINVNKIQLPLFICSQTKQHVMFQTTVFLHQTHYRFSAGPKQHKPFSDLKLIYKRILNVGLLLSKFNLNLEIQCYIIYDEYCNRGKKGAQMFSFCISG